MQIAFDLVLAACFITAAYRWYELEKEWRIAKHPYLKEQNEQLNIWLAKEKIDFDPRDRTSQIFAAKRGK